MYIQVAVLFYSILGTILKLNSEKYMQGDTPGGSVIIISGPKTHKWFPKLPKNQKSKPVNVSTHVTQRRHMQKLPKFLSVAYYTSELTGHLMTKATDQNLTSFQQKIARNV